MTDFYRSTPFPCVCNHTFSKIKTTEKAIEDVISRVKKHYTNKHMFPRTPAILTELIAQPLYNRKVRCALAVCIVVQSSLFNTAKKLRNMDNTRIQMSKYNFVFMKSDRRKIDDRTYEMK